VKKSEKKRNFSHPCSSRENEPIKNTGKAYLAEFQNIRRFDGNVPRKTKGWQNRDYHPFKHA
jgi:hypothetical protein